MGVSVYWLLSVLCVFLCVFVCVLYQIRVPAKKTHYVSDLSKFDTLLHKTHIKVQGPSITKVPRLDMCRSIISLSKIAYQMCCDHPFSQRSKTTERAVGVGVGVDF